MPGPMEGTMKLGLHLGYSGAELSVPVAMVQRAEAWATIRSGRPRRTDRMR